MKTSLRWVQIIYHEIAHGVQTKFTKPYSSEINSATTEQMLVTVRRHGDNRQVFCSDSVRHPRDASDRKIW